MVYFSIRYYDSLNQKVQSQNGECEENSKQKVHNKVAKSNAQTYEIKNNRSTLKQ